MILLDLRFTASSYSSVVHLSAFCFSLTEAGILSMGHKQTFITHFRFSPRLFYPAQPLLPPQLHPLRQESDPWEHIHRNGPIASA
mmetsp:Transcript_16919/g.29521  ORF Transcript_16919/g.29521 Transcript_16919/m.29521 type:complete len:85 (+) Transcript_16919:21-275(+)